MDWFCPGLVVAERIGRVSRPFFVDAKQARCVTRRGIDKLLALHTFGTAFLTLSLRGCIFSAVDFFVHRIDAVGASNKGKYYKELILYFGFRRLETATYLPYVAKIAFWHNGCSISNAIEPRLR